MSRFESAIPTIMRQYLIKNEHREEIIQWCSENMEPGVNYTWFPHYVTQTYHEPAFRLDIFDDEYAIIFSLTWNDFIDDAHQPRPPRRSR